MIIDEYFCGTVIVKAFDYWDLITIDVLDALTVIRPASGHRIVPVARGKLKLKVGEK